MCPPGVTHTFGDVLMCCALLVSKTWESDDSITTEVATLIFSFICSLLLLLLLIVGFDSELNLMGQAGECL